MGKKGGDSNGGGEKAVAARVFVLKVAMHCHCRGCVDRIRAAVRDLTLLHGVEAVDQSAVETSGEVRLLATADPERLRHRLRKATRKNVDLILLPPPKPPAPPKKEAQDRHLVDQLLAQYGAWPPNHQPLGGWNNGSLYGAAAAHHPAAHHPAAYPWAPSSSSYPAAAWGGGPYAYPPPPAQGHGGGYYSGASAPAWHGY